MGIKTLFEKLTRKMFLKTAKKVAKISLFYTILVALSTTLT